MIDQELQRLLTGGRNGRLDRLEQDIWAREARLKSMLAASRALARWQSVVLALAIFGSALLGVAAASRVVVHPDGNWFSASARLAPSNLLLVGRR